MYGEFVAAVNSLKAVADIGKGLMSLHTMTEVQGKAIELNQLILDAHQSLFTAQTAQSSLVEEVRDLKGQIAAMKNWDAEKQRYKLIAPFPGCMVFALQKSMSDGETAHYLCATCFKKGQPSILQAREGRPLGKDKGYAHGCYTCPECGSEASTGYMNVPAPQYFEDIKPEG